jgi:hypothetical protein
VCVYIEIEHFLHLYEVYSGEDAASTIF